MNGSELQFDFVIIGSGFGGAVPALRLAEKGYRVAVLEAGKRYRTADFARSNWDLRRYLWAPFLRCFGIQAFTFLPGVLVLHGAGVGGGSLVYANTLMRPIDSVFKEGQWPHAIDWASELDPHYATARRMLGATRPPELYPAQALLRELAQDLGCEDTFRAVDVGIYFGDGVHHGAEPDPYFKGQGPSRVPCTACGACMVGCRVGAKNTLDQNYLYLAERKGTRVFPETQADRIEPCAEGGYRVRTRRTTSLFGLGSGPTFKAERVIVAASVIGTLKLLFKNRDGHRTLPKISPKLGDHVRTNGESLLGATSFHSKVDYSRGIAIGAIIQPDARTQIETCVYPSGSSAIRLLAVPLTGGGPVAVRWFKLAARLIADFTRWTRVWTVKDWAKQSVVLLVMQTLNSELRLRKGRGLGWRQAAAPRVRLPNSIPIAQDSATHLARRMGGYAQNVASEVLAGVPATAHILGGCSFGASAAEGVINERQEVHGYPGLYISDGSVIASNLGVNPSLTITALAERFTQQFPSRKVPE